MPIAFVMINTEIDSMEEVLKDLKETSNVKEAYMVYGVYDIIAKVEAESMRTLKEVISSQIRTIDKVRATLTMIVMET